MRVIRLACVVVASVHVAAAQPVVPPPVPLSGAEKRAAEKAARARAEAACSARAPDCDWIATLSGLERLSMRRALAARGYTVEPSPWTKVIGKIHVYNEDVFAEKNRLLQLLNFFHYTTRDRTIRADLVAEPGMVYTQEIVEETARRLRDPLFSSVIAIIPVRSADPGKVDLLVVTRDIWSLRLNTQYTFQQGELTNLATSLSENNFLGSRTVIAAALTMDQGAILAGPLLIDKNVLGQHYEFRGRVNTIINRDRFFDGDWENEGSSSDLRLSKVLWKLSSKWGGAVSFTHRFAIQRSYSGLALRPVHCPIDQACTFPTRDVAATLPDDELIPYAYRQRSWAVSASATRQWGTRIKHQVSFGHVVDSTRPRLLPDTPGTGAQKAAFRAILPPEEVDSAPFVSYSFFEPRYKTRRNVQTYDLAEDLRIGGDAEISYGVGLEAFGSTNNFQRGGVGGGYTLPWSKDGSVRLGASYSARYQGGELGDNAFQVSSRLVSPSLGGYARVVAEATVATRWNDRIPRFFYIGSDNGLRGFAINEFFGKRLAGTQIELRSTPVPLWVLRLGGVVFYDAGGAADTFGELRVHHDVGIGLRSLLPQTSRELFRFDLALPLDGAERFNPRFIAGFQSEF